MAATEEQIAYLRHLIADASSTPVISDEIIEMLFSQNDGYIKGAVAEGWAMKAARYSELVDITESGSTRILSQKFRQAMAMAAHWMKQVEKESPGVNFVPVVGRVAKILEDGDTIVINEYIGEESFPIANVRPYPTHRMPSVL